MSEHDDEAVEPTGVRARAAASWSRVPTWGQILIVVAVVVGVPGLVYLVQDPNGAGGATRACEERVEDRLTSPSTAEFGERFDSQDDEGRWQISGSVDSENGFGAMVRNAYSCTVTNENGFWQLVDLSFAEE